MCEKQESLIGLRCETTDGVETFEGNPPDALHVLQAKEGYRYSIDPFLLCEFVKFPRGASVMDLGSGSGIILLLLALKKTAGRLVGLEVQLDLVERSRRSIELNRLGEHVDIVRGDVRALPEQFAAESFEVVVTNPPYRTATSGRLSSGDERSRARHELAGGLVDFLRAANFLLQPGGRFFIVYLAERLPELLAEMRCCRLEPKRMRLVYSREGDDARMVLVEGRKNGRPGLRVSSPLVIYKAAAENDYTDEIASIYNGALRS